MPKAIDFAPPLVALLLGCSALSNTAQAGWFSSDSKPVAPAANKDDKPGPQPAVTLDDSIRQAQMLRLAGNYAEAINHLSQLMLVAADDPRIISEYGKTLVSMGRAEEAEKFLTRAQQLQPDDWTVYSALGVAYDEIGDQKDAQVNYERALALKPGESSVLNNYALSRMLAKDPAMARKLADRAEIANAAAKDDKITRNIAMIRTTAPEINDGLAVNTPAPGAIAPPVTAPRVAVATAPLAPAKPAQPVSPVTKSASAPVASSVAPRPLSSASAAQAQPQAQAVNQVPRGVVMQPVPVDLLAGPVGPKTAATHAPRILQPNPQVSSETPVKSDTSVKTAAKADAPKPASPAQNVVAKAQANAPGPNKPAAIAQAKPAAAKVAQVKPAAASVAQAKPEAGKGLQAKNEPAKPAAPAAKVSLPVKAADVKPTAGQLAPKVLAATPVKATDAKTGADKTKSASKDAIPSLRLSANAY